MIFLAVCSMVGSLFVASMIFSSKKLQVHPNRLIGYTCLSEAVSSFNAVIWTMNTRYIVTYMDLNQFMAWTFFSKDYTSYIELLTYSNDFFFQYFSLLTLCLNSCLCIDLMLTLQSPFTPAKKRMKLYLVFSLLLCAPLTWLTKPSIDVVNKGKDSPFN